MINLQAVTTPFLGINMPVFFPHLLFKKKTVVSELAAMSSRLIDRLLFHSWFHVSV